MERECRDLPECSQVEVLARIDNNIRWIMKIGSVVGTLVLILGGVLYSRDWMQSEAIASVRLEAQRTADKVDQHIDKHKYYLEERINNGPVSR